MAHHITIDNNAEFALIARGHYGDANASVKVIHKSDQAHKREAEKLFLLASVLEWAKGEGIVIDGEKVRYG